MWRRDGADDGQEGVRAVVAVDQRIAERGQQLRQGGFGLGAEGGQAPEDFEVQSPADAVR